MKKNYFPIPVAAAVIGIVFGLTACQSKTGLPETAAYAQAGETAIVLPLPDVSDSPEPETDAASVIDFSAAVPQDADAPAAFSASVDDYIESFNSEYEKTHAEAYLPPLVAAGWTQTPGLSPRFGCESVQFRYSEDPAVWPMPTVSVYASEDASAVYELQLIFDDHGYREDFYELFRELCLCTIRGMLPELSGRDAETIFKDLYAHAWDDFFGDHSFYGDPERPPLSRVLRCENVGLYSCYGSGTVEICMIPLTQSALDTLQSETIPIEDWEISK